jgi:hypothetical protein
MRTPKLRRALAMSLFATAAFMTADMAMGNPPAHVLGTSSADVPSARYPARLPTTLTIKPANKYQNANYATGGVALRNRSEGVINISGMVGVRQAAWLYFAYLFTTAPPATLVIPVRRYFPLPVANQNVTATLIGVSADPCWGSAGGAVYKGKVGIAVGNGEYRVTVPPAVVGLNTGEDPWNGNVVFPLDEGATLVMVGTGGGTVNIFDKGLAGNEFQASFSYTLALSAPTTGAPVLLDNFGADGQLGYSRQAFIASETTFINAVQVAGPGSPSDTDSDWNGNSGFPLPQLWDDIGHDITPAAPAGTGTLATTINSQTDCLITVGNVVSY